MDKLDIQTHSFETAKNQLKQFSEQTAKDLDLKRVDTSKGLGEWLLGGGVGLSHKVTGEELNSLTSQIQTHLIDIKNVHLSFIQEFGQVFNALEALDRDYIQAILIAIKSAQKANNEVKMAQDDIEKTIALQKKTIDVLEHFKVKIGTYQHLVDINQMWVDCQDFKNDIAVLKETISSQEELISNLQDRLSSEQVKTETMQKANNEVKMAQDDIEKTIALQKKTIDVLEDFKVKIGTYQHLVDINQMWVDCQDFKNDIAVLKETISSQEELISNLQDRLSSEQEKIETISKDFSQKNQIAYFLAVGAIGLVVVEFILMMMRVI